MALKKKRLRLIPLLFPYILLGVLVLVNIVFASDWSISPDWSVSDDWNPPVSYPPVAVFTKNASTIYVNDTIAFNGSGSYDVDGTIESYAWVFGDGNTSALVAENNTYRTVGVYSVTLTVTDNSALTGNVSQTVWVLEEDAGAEGIEIGFSSFDVESSLGFMCDVNQTLVLTVTDGEITSQNITMDIQRKRGRFTYIATNNATIALTINALAVRVQGDQGREWHGVADGHVLTVVDTNFMEFEWEAVLIDYFDLYTNLGIGIFGFLCVGVGCFWSAKQVRSAEPFIINRLVSFGFALTFLILGVGLIIGWLW